MNFYFKEIVYKCSVSVYTNISGLVTIRSSDFQINSYNSTFARLLLGYNEHELLNKVNLNFAQYKVKIKHLSDVARSKELAAP